MSSGRRLRVIPFFARPTAVRAAATITASRLILLTPSPAQPNLRNPVLAVSHHEYVPLRRVPVSRSKRPSPRASATSRAFQFPAPLCPVHEFLSPPTCSNPPPYGAPSTRVCYFSPVPISRNEPPDPRVSANSRRFQSPVASRPICACLPIPAGSIRPHHSAPSTSDFHLPRVPFSLTIPPNLEMAMRMARGQELR